MSITHETWTVEREYPVPPDRVFAAWADPATKVRWFVGPNGAARRTYSSDFRVGGLETARTAVGTTPIYTYDAEYRDIIDGQRIVTTYEMSLDGHRISVSVATAELVATSDGTLLRYTEQGAYLDDLDRPEWRREGVAGQLDRLGAELAG